MDQRRLKAALKDLSLGGLRFFEQVGSTNDIALAWAAEGVADFALVVAEEQTSGRGRNGHRWYTPAGAALAFSLVLRPGPAEQENVSLISALGALSVVSALEKDGMKPEIKWPNDILLARRKVSGMLTEAVWMGDAIDSLILGIGVNVSSAAVPPPDLLAFPATCLEAAAGRTVDRVLLLHDILSAMVEWRPLLKTSVFFDAWQERLAFQGERVEVWGEGETPRAGTLEGLMPDGSLRLRSLNGDSYVVQFGEVHLRPVV